MTADLTPQASHRPRSASRTLNTGGSSPLRISPQAAGVWLAGVGLALLLGILASNARSWGAPLAALAVLAVGAYYIRVLGLRPGLVVLLIVAAVADRFTFGVGPLALRAEQVAALAAVVALAVAALRERRWGWLKPNLAEAFLLAWLASNLASSLLASPDRRLSAKILALFAISSLGLFLPRRLLAGRGAVDGMETVVRWLLIAFATEAGYGTIVYLLHVVGPTISLGVNPASGYLSAYGTLWEQNVFGAFCAAGLVAWAYLGSPRYRWAWAGMVACLGGLVDSLTRAAWLAALLVGGLGLLVGGNRRRLDLPAIARASIGGLVMVALTLVAIRFGAYSYSVVPVGGPAGTGGPGGPGGPGGSGAASPGFLAAVFNRVDLLGRFNQLSQVWDDIHAHLLFGRGTAAFEVLHQFKSVPEHLASLPLNVLDGTGLVGLVLFTAFAVAVFVRAWSRRGDQIVHALGQVALVIVIANMSTETLELMVGWLLVGLLLAAIDCAAQTAPGPQPRAPALAQPDPPEAG